jgi:hypothetical protein
MPARTSADHGDPSHSFKRFYRGPEAGLPLKPLGNAANRWNRRDPLILP